MSKPEPLTEQQIRSALAELPGWSLDSDQLGKTFTFANFVEAFGFVARVAVLAEKHEHHPDWCNSYNRVTIKMTTHDAGNKVTRRDTELAAAIERVAAK